MRFHPSLIALRQVTSAGLLGLTILLGGCSLFVPPATVRGNRIDADELKQLVPGTTTQADATSLLGSPTAKGSFDPNSWYYISELTRPVIGGTQGVDQQGVVVLSFNAQGVLEHVQTLNQHDSLSVPIVARTTPSPGTEFELPAATVGQRRPLQPGLPARTGPNRRNPGAVSRWANWR